MRITVSRLIDFNGKIEEKTVTAEIEDDDSSFITDMDTPEEQRASNMARALFDSMNPQPQPK